jgi:hypothetical protein
MSVLLFVVGAIAAMVGVGMVGYGIPINEFSFGNTLIVAGTTAAVGGLIVMAIGVAVGQLQRIAEMLTTRPPARPSRPLDMFEPPAGARAAPVPSRIPFPPRPKSEPPVRERQPPAEMPADEYPAAQAAPTLRNPDLPVAMVEEFEVKDFEFKEYDDVSLSPQQSIPTPAPTDLGEPAPPPRANVNASPVTDKSPEPTFDASWRASPTPQPQERQSQTSYFDAMWPAESRPAKRPLSNEAKPEPPPPAMAAPEAPTPQPVEEPPVAILKSGVVDGMGYTLYVDGSIEAELPQGTLRFASINDLRSHLAKNS